VWLLLLRGEKGLSPAWIPMLRTVPEMPAQKLDPIFITEIFR
jgi:hypothetical protein